MITFPLYPDSSEPMIGRESISERAIVVRKRFVHTLLLLVSSRLVSSLPASQLFFTLLTLYPLNRIHLFAASKMHLLQTKSDLNLGNH